MNVIKNSYVNIVFKLHKLTNRTLSVFPTTFSFTSFTWIQVRNTVHTMCISEKLTLPVSSHSHNLPSSLISLCTDSINCTWRNMWGLLLSQYLLLKCLAVPHLSFFVLMMFLCVVNLALKSVAEPTYWSPQFLIR